MKLISRVALHRKYINFHLTLSGQRLIQSRVGEKLEISYESFVLEYLNIFIINSFDENTIELFLYAFIATGAKYFCMRGIPF